ncbi:MAG: hypothetical protein IPG86_15700 [Chitinophagaceae bacterium]|nr:hypothetical protein [Chitinophagaceae bacterium]
MESSIVLRKWLEYANDFNFVKDYLSELLEYNKNEKITGSFLIGDSMLSCLEGFNLAKPYALKWLQIYGDSEEAFFVVSSYCRAIEKLKLNPECISEVKEFIIPCLKRNYKYISPNDSWKWRQNILLKHSDDWEP